MELEYPTQAEFEEMPNDTRLESITFDSFKGPHRASIGRLSYGLSSAQVNLSHGFSSNIEIKNFKSQIIYAKTINFPD